jgi:integrase/recombinase XerC
MPATERDLRFIRLHCDWLRRTGATDVTQNYRRGVLRRLAGHLPGDLIDATPEDLDAWQSSLDLTLSTIAGYTSNVRRFYQWAVEAGHLDIDPSVRLPLPKVPQRRPRPVPDADLRTALLCAPEPVRTWLVLAAFMGLRAMEVAGIHREHITEVDGRLYLDGIGKGRKAFRLPIPPEVAKSLRPYLAGGSGPMWRTAPGRRPSRPKDVSEQTILFFRAIGMPYSLHQLRHSFGTAFYAQSKDLLLTQQVMRHRSPTTTRQYVETASAEATRAMDRLARRLSA